MKVKILRHLTAKMKSTWRHDDSCGCSGAEWVDQFFPKDEEVEATTDSTPWACQDGTIQLDGLKFREDYDIIEFP